MALGHTHGTGRFLPPSGSTPAHATSRRVNHSAGGRPRTGGRDVDRDSPTRTAIAMLIGEAGRLPNPRARPVHRRRVPIGRHTGRHRHGEEAIHILSGLGQRSSSTGRRYDFHAGDHDSRTPTQSDHQLFNTGDQDVRGTCLPIGHGPRPVRAARPPRADRGEGRQQPRHPGRAYRPRTASWTARVGASRFTSRTRRTKKRREEARRLAAERGEPVAARPRPRPRPRHGEATAQGDGSNGTRCRGERRRAAYRRLRKRATPTATERSTSSWAAARAQVQERNGFAAVSSR